MARDSYHPSVLLTPAGLVIFVDGPTWLRDAERRPEKMQRHMHVTDDGILEVVVLELGDGFYEAHNHYRPQLAQLFRRAANAE